MANPAEFDIPDDLAKIVDHHISEMFPEEMHADLRLKLREMCKSFYSSCLNTLGACLVDKMIEMVSLLSFQLKNQTCTCKGKQGETDNLSAESSLCIPKVADDPGCSADKKEFDLASILREKFGVVNDEDIDYISNLKDKYTESKNRLYKMLFSNAMRAPSNEIEGNELKIEVFGKSVTWSNFYVGMKGEGWVDPSLMDLFLECERNDRFDSDVYIPSSLAMKFDVGDFDPSKLVKDFEDHGVEMNFNTDEKVFITCCDDSHWWVLCGHCKTKKFDVLSSLDLTDAQMATTKRTVESFKIFYKYLYGSLDYRDSWWNMKIHSTPICSKESAKRDCGIYAMRFVRVWLQNVKDERIWKADIDGFREHLTGFMIESALEEGGGVVPTFIRQCVDDYKKQKEDKKSKKRRME